MRTRLLVWWMVWASLPWWGMAGGLPEPHLTFYGAVYNAEGVRQTNGAILINLKDGAGKTVFVLRGSLSNINDQFSYALPIPCEWALAGVKAGDVKIALNSGARYDRSEISVNGQRLLYLAPEQAMVDLSPSQRGASFRGDVSPTGSLGQGDGDHLLDSWERRYFGDLRYGDMDDPDGDGVPNVEEQSAGTDPTDRNSALAFTHVESNGSGIAVSWSSMAGHTYRLYRSTDVLSGYAIVADNLAATPPVNRFADTQTAGSSVRFYRVEVKP